MIKKLDIENFMLFKKLEVPTLKRVNLIGGRNNSGKTALLEAIRIYVSQGNAGVINQVLINRQLFKGNKNTYNGLFNEKLISTDKDVLLQINNLQIVRAKNELSEWEYGGRLDSKSEKYLFNLSRHTLNIFPEDKCVFLPVNCDYASIKALWEEIALTYKEDELIDILKETIEPDLFRIDVGQNIVRVKLTGNEKPIPLGILGDGVRRILLIALGLANAQNSILLIDEIELGLHHSVIEKLWKMIFKYAKKWNIQVFVTTHSQDALRTFTYIASEEENKAEAQFIRLQIGRTGKNEAILFDTERLRTTLDLALEIR